jgi:hypothetical protein
MHSRLAAVTFEADDPVRAGRFWAALLSREVIQDAAGALPGRGRTARSSVRPGRSVGEDSTVVLADPDGNEFSVRETDHSVPR